MTRCPIGGRIGPSLRPRPLATPLLLVQHAGNGKESVTVSRRTSLSKAFSQLPALVDPWEKPARGMCKATVGMWHPLNETQELLRGEARNGFSTPSKGGGTVSDMLRDPTFLDPGPSLGGRPPGSGGSQVPMPLLAQCVQTRARAERKLGRRCLVAFSLEPGEARSKISHHVAPLTSRTPFCPM